MRPEQDSQQETLTILRWNWARERKGSFAPSTPQTLSCPHPGLKTLPRLLIGSCSDLPLVIVSKLSMGFLFCFFNSLAYKLAVARSRKFTHWKFTELEAGRPG